MCTSLNHDLKLDLTEAANSIILWKTQTTLFTLKLTNIHNGLKKSSIHGNKVSILTYFPNIKSSMKLQADAIPENSGFVLCACAAHAQKQWIGWFVR